MGSEWKSERVEEILVSLICVWWKSVGMKKFFCLVEKKSERIENVIYIN